LKKTGPHIDTENGEFVQSLQSQRIELEMQNVELIQAREKAEIATDKYAELYDFAPVGYFTLSNEGKIIDLNLCGSQMLCKERKSLLNAPFDSFVAHHTKPLFLSFLKKIFISQTKEICEIILSIDDQSCIDVSLSGIVALNHKQCLIVAQDISERKRAERILLENEEKFRSIIQYSSDPIFSFNRDESYRFVNRAFATTLGKRPEEIMGRTPHSIFPFEEAEQRLSLVRRVFQTGKKGEIEVLVITSSGEEQYYLTTVDPVKNDQEEVLYVNCVSKEITQLKNTEKALKKSEARINALLAAMPDMLFIQDKEGVYIDYHGPLSAELYVQPEYFIGKNMRDILPADILNKFQRASEKAFKTGEVQLRKYSLLLPDGRNYFESKVVAFDNDKILNIVRNVTPYKIAEQLIKSKNGDLQRINAEKDKFFSIIAHDLRSPFSGFLGLTESMAKKLPGMSLSEIQDITSILQNSAAHLFRLLGNLLEWSSMQRGITPFDPKLFAIRQKISEILILSVDAANRKNISIICDIPDQLHVIADEKMFESIVRNLLSNAVKFTPFGGRIVVSACRKSKGMVVISVTDTGIGMNPQLIGDLFRLDIPSNRKGTEGEYSTGLGLIISRDFIHKHGGKLWIESEEGKGSTFRFALPELNEK
jgi:hypothetical protein